MHPGDLVRGCYDLEMTWLLAAALAPPLKNITTSARFYVYIREITYQKMFMYFLDCVCVRTLSHLYGYTTARARFLHTNGLSLV